MKKLLDWVYRHYGLTLLIVVWGLGLFTAITLKVFFEPVLIPTETVAAYGTFFAMFGIVIGLFKWRRGKGKHEEEDK